MPGNIFIQDLEKSGSGFNLTDVNGALGEALKHLYSNYKALCVVVGENESLKKKTIDGLLYWEEQAKEAERSWRVVIDFSIDKKGKHLAPIVQFCNGSPDYNRYVIEFDAELLQHRIATSCVEVRPDMTVIKGGVTEEQKARGMTLARAKEFYDKKEMQRIAILGAARVYPYESNPNEERRRKKERDSIHKSRSNRIE